MMLIDKIQCCDCLDGLKSLPDECIDLTVTSPPYDNLRTYNGYSWNFDGIADELLRITKSGGVIVWIVADATVDGSETGSSFRQALHFKERCAILNLLESILLHFLSNWQRITSSHGAIKETLS